MRRVRAEKKLVKVFTFSTKCFIESVMKVRSTNSFKSIFDQKAKKCRGFIMEHIQIVKKNCIGISQLRFSSHKFSSVMFKM